MQNEKPDVIILATGAVPVKPPIKEIAPEETIRPRWQLIEALENRKVQIRTGVKVTEITEDSVKAMGENLRPYVTYSYLRLKKGNLVTLKCRIY